MDLKKTLKVIREEIENGERHPFNSDAKKHYLHSIAIAAEALVEIAAKEDGEKK